MSLVIEELLPFDCLNVNILFCSQPQLSKKWVHVHETYTIYINIYFHSMMFHTMFCEDVLSLRRVIAL